MSPSTSLIRTLLRRGGAGASPEALRETPVDRAVLSGTLGPATLSRLRDRGEPWSAEDVILCMDFHVPQVESRVPRARALCRELAGAWGLKHVFDLNAGIGTVAVVEWGIVRPGQVVIGTGRCMGILGGIGALGLRLEEEGMTAALLTGRAPAPEGRVVRVKLEGRLPRRVGAWDLARAITARVAATGAALELGGESRVLPLDFRSALCGLLVEMGAATALVEPDALVETFYRERGIEARFPAPADDAPFDDEVSIDLGSVPAVIAAAYDAPAQPVSGGVSDAVHGAFVGSCYGGFLGDLAVAAEILKKAGRVHPDVRLTLSPASMDIARAALHAGYYEIFFQAGAMVTVPGASAGSVGGGAILGEGERLASTMEYHRNIEPGQGKPEVRVMSPAAATAAAVAGRVVDPAAYLS